MKNIDYWYWVEKFKPIRNHLDSTASIDGCLFLPFGKQFEFVKQINKKYLWSLIVTDLDDDDTLWEITNGIHMVNMQGILITKVPYLEDMTITY